MLSLSKIREILNCEVLYGDHAMGRIASSCIASDRLSYVLSSGSRDSILVTCLTSPQAVRTAYMIDSIAVIFAKGATPHEDVVEVGSKSDLPLLKTDLSLTETCEMLASAGIKM